MLSSKQSQICHDIDRFQYIRKEMSRNCKSVKEKAKIVQAVNRLAKNVAAMLSHAFGLPCSSKLVGSAEEKTRCFQPDEFDFLLIFYNIDRHFEYHSCGERSVLFEMSENSQIQCKKQGIH